MSVTTFIALNAFLDAAIIVLLTLAMWIPYFLDRDLRGAGVRWRVSPARSDEWTDLRESVEAIVNTARSADLDDSPAGLEPPHAVAN
jgi:hypothetical protein